MPARRNNNQPVNYIIQQEDLHLCSNYLTENYWKMCKDLHKQLECPVCMQDLINPPSCEMSKGFALLTCGHCTCLRCYFSQLHSAQQDNELFACPVCRTWFFLLWNNYNTPWWSVSVQKRVKPLRKLPVQNARGVLGQQGRGAGKMRFALHAGNTKPKNVTAKKQNERPRSIGCTRP